MFYFVILFGYLIIIFYFVLSFTFYILNMPRRRTNNRRRTRPRRRMNLLPYEVTILATQTTPAIVNIVASDFNLPNNRPIGIVNYSITATASEPTSLQVTLLNGLEEVTATCLTIGQSRCFFRGRMPVVLPRTYTQPNIQIMRFNFTETPTSRCIITIRLNVRTYGVLSRPFSKVTSDGRLAEISPSDTQLYTEESFDSCDMPCATTKR